MPDVVWCIPTRGITYSVSHHDGCCLVHPDTWYHLFGLPSCRMLFGAPRHVVSIIIIRSPIMTDVVWCTRHVISLIRSLIMSDAVWCTPTRGITYSVSHHDGCCVVSLIRSPIMTDAVWCTPTRGITYLISHHAGCRLVHPDTWYHLFGLPSCQMPFGAPRHVVSLIRPPIMPDAVWCTPTRGIT